MPQPDFSMYTPQGGGGRNGPGAYMDLMQANNLVDVARTNADTALQQGRMNTQFSQETMPQLQSGIASAGQWYGSARRTAEGTAQRHKDDAYGDIGLAANRHLNDLTRQQSMAAVGLVI